GEGVGLEDGGLELASTIDVVEIFVNDQRVGETRRGRVLVIDRLGAGVYHVRAQRPGYRPWTREVQVALNERVEVQIELERKEVSSAKMRRTSSPWSSTVWGTRANSFTAVR